MLKRTYVNDNLETLKTALEECPILSDCVVTVADSRLTISDQNGNPLFQIWRASNQIHWIVWVSEDTYVTTVNGTDSYVAHINYCYACDNGAVIYNTSRNGLPIRIVKTTRGELAFIFYDNSSVPTSTAMGFSRYLQCIAWGDIEPFDKIDIPNRYDTHAMVVPMLTNSDANVVSYTAKSGVMPYSTQDAAMKVIDIAGKKHLADGYFAIEFEDSEETEES